MYHYFSLILLKRVNMKILLFLIFTPLSALIKAQNCKECACYVQKAKQLIEKPNFDTLLYLSNHIIDAKCIVDDYHLYKAHLLAGFKQLIDSELNAKKKEEIKKGLPYSEFWFNNDSLLPIVNREGKYGFVDKNLDVKISYQYDAATSFSMSLGKYAEVKRNNKDYYLDIHQNEYLISYSLTNLSHDVKILILRMPELKQMPDSICRYTNLKILYVNYTKIESLPKEIAQLHNLEELYLVENPLNRLPDDFGKLKKLIAFYASDCKIRELPISFSELSALKRCNLRNNQINMLPNNFGNLKKLEELDLSWCPVTQLPNSLHELNNLKGLRLIGTKITVLPDYISTFKNLRELSISNLSSPLPPRFGELQALKSLTLPNAYFEKFPREILELKNLHTLWLFGSKLTELPKRIDKLKKLQLLDVSNTKIKAIPPSIGNLKRLHYLAIGKSLTKLPKQIGQLDNLESLYLFNNKISKLPDDIVNLKKLSSLYLGGNPISKEEIEKFKAKMPNCKISLTL